MIYLISIVPPCWKFNGIGANVFFVHEHILPLLPGAKFIPIHFSLIYQSLYVFAVGWHVCPKQVSWYLSAWIESVFMVDDCELVVGNSLSIEQSPGPEDV